MFKQKRFKLYVATEFARKATGDREREANEPCGQAE